MRPGYWTLFLFLAMFPSQLLAQSGAVQPRISPQAIDESKLTVLLGNTHPLAQARFDHGAAPAGLPMNRMLMVLQRSPEQESALKQLLEDQQDKASPNYHKWMTPEQFGQQFGPADQDIQAITAWLQTHGFQVAPVSKGRTVLEFSGTAAQVQEAFHTSIHQYVVNGEKHLANATDPQIPAGLAPVIRGMVSLHDFRAKPLYRKVGVVSRAKDTGAVTVAQPLLTFPNGGCGVQPTNCYAVGPYDFATIYDVLPLWNASPAINGAGQTIAIVGETDINPSDVASFRTYFGLPAANLQVIHDGEAPGILSNGEETESDLDVEWSGAVAPGATIDFVVAGSTETTQGVDLSALHIVDNNLAPVMSESYGNCELFIGTAANQFFNQLWQQAAAEGITVMVSSGDSGAAGCDRETVEPPQPAIRGLQVSGFASTPYNIAVGGTDFDQEATAARYWNLTNSPNTQASAKSYIPETAWNDSCTNVIFDTFQGFSPNVEENCNNPRLVDFVSANGGSGGKSGCTTSDGRTPASCTGGYPKPAWQSALSPNDGARDVPDVSLFAADGLEGSFYLICEADQGPAACNPNAPNGDFLGIGGTSASSPAFAGIMALVNQQTGERQGNANYTLYKLATQQPSAFHDVINGTIAMPCQSGSTNCTTMDAGDQYGVLAGYAAATGYDLATGLGSVDAFILVSKWNSVTLTPSVTTLSGVTPTTLTHGQSASVTVGVTPQSGTGAPSGAVALIGGPSGSAAPFDSHILDASGNATWNTSLLPGGTYNVTAHYLGDGIYSSSDSATSIPVTVNKENPALNVGLVTFDFTGRVISNGTTTATYGSPYILRAALTGTTCSSNSRGQLGCPKGSVGLTDNGVQLDAGTYPLNELGYAEDDAIQLPGGAHAVQTGYSGDNSFSAIQTTTNITINPASTVTLPPSTATTPTVGSTLVLTTTIQTQSFGMAPTGTVTFLENGSPLPGTVQYSPVAYSPLTLVTANLQASLQLPLSAPGNDVITASYSGDQNYSSSSSGPLNLQVRYPQPAGSISSSPSNVMTGSPVTVTATFDSGGNGPAMGGSMTFFVSGGGYFPGTGAVVGTPGTDNFGFPTLRASITFNALSSGNITVLYSGDSNYPQTSANGFLNVTQPGFTFSANPTSVTVTRGMTAQAALTIAGDPGYNATVNFNAASCVGLPTEAMCTFTPTSLIGSGTVQLSIVTSGPHARRWPGGIAGVIKLQIGLTLSAFGVFFLKGSKKRRGKALLLCVAIAALLAAPSCGGGSGSAGGNGVGTVGNTDPGTPPGSYTVVILASSPSATRETAVQVVVQ